MSKSDINIKPLGKQAILIEWPKKVDDQILDEIIQFTSSIVSIEKKDLTNYTPGYNSLLLQYSSDIDFVAKRTLIYDLYNSHKEIQNSTANEWHIPVCYDDSFGLDLSLFSNKGLSKSEIIQLHTSTPI